MLAVAAGAQVGAAFATPAEPSAMTAADASTRKRVRFMRFPPALFSLARRPGFPTSVTGARILPREPAGQAHTHVPVVVERQFCVEDEREGRHGRAGVPLEAPEMRALAASP